MIYVDEGIFKNLLLAALGHHISVVERDERGAAYTFRRYVTALDNFDLDKTLWSARGSNGNHKIQFNNGGYIQFFSHKWAERSTDKLLPCPFCGGAASVIDDWPTPFDAKPLCGVGCANKECIAYTGYGTMLFDSQDEAIAAWNRRM